MTSTSIPDQTRETGQRFDLTSSGQSVLRAFSSALSLLQNGKLAVPLIIYFILRLAILKLYLSGIAEPWSSFWALFMRGLTSDQLSRCPAHLVLMPAILGRFDMVLGVFVQVIFDGATILLVASAFRKTLPSLKAGFSGAVKKYPHLVGVMLLASLGILIGTNLPGIIAGHLSWSSRFGITAAAALLGLVVQALFVYALPLVLLDRHRTIRGVGESFKIALHSIIKTFLLVALPFILTLPTMLLESKAEMIALRLSPDFMIYIHVAGEIMQVISTYLVMGGATIIFLRIMEKTANGRRSNRQTTV
ncbi:MAG: hypothetical protein KAX38_08290 [Candidatus Krumholzibacteria bacterium]|nr:hypothetical protein [Candidatus Krumholzibacteria bacterium]